MALRKRFQTHLLEPTMRIVVAVAFSFFLYVFLTLSVNPTAMNAAAAAAAAFLEKKSRCWARLNAADAA